MITSRFPLGDVSFSAEYFSTLVGEATKHCYGVAAMAPGQNGPGRMMGGNGGAEAPPVWRRRNTRRPQEVRRRSLSQTMKQERSAAGTPCRSGPRRDVKWT